MSANLSSDEADRSRFRLSRVSDAEFRIPRVSTARGLDQVVNALLLVLSGDRSPRLSRGIDEVIKRVVDFISCLRRCWYFGQLLAIIGESGFFKEKFNIPRVPFIIF